MGRKFNNIDNIISQQNRSFKIFLKEFMLDNDSWELLTLISEQTSVYIFSGVIRNFLLGYIDNRDLDIVIGNIDDICIPSKYLRNISYKRNSFGGYKLKIGMIIVDVWDINNTWGIRRLNLSKTPISLIKTAFFNFSSIVYDFKNEKFIYDDFFLEFYKTHAMDIRYEDNPNIPLCIVNTFYYSLKYSFPIKYNLCKWVIEHYNMNLDFESVQQNHFNRIIFTNRDVIYLINLCCIFVGDITNEKNALLLEKKQHIKFNIVQKKYIYIINLDK